MKTRVYDSNGNLIAATKGDVEVKEVERKTKNYRSEEVGVKIIDKDGNVLVENKRFGRKAQINKPRITKTNENKNIKEEIVEVKTEDDIDPKYKKWAEEVDKSKGPGKPFNWDSTLYPSDKKLRKQKMLRMEEIKEAKERMKVSSEEPEEVIDDNEEDIEEVEAEVVEDKVLPENVETMIIDAGYEVPGIDLDGDYEDPYSEYEQDIPMREKIVNKKGVEY